MGTDFEFSGPQWAAISAPLEPAVVIAGAGSGKTSVMAARVVYLVATGQVAPDEVLGLTFTTKATAELASKVRKALVESGLDEPVVLTRRRTTRCPSGSSPWSRRTTPTPPSLLTEHGLRIGHEPDTRVMADASRYQVAARAIERHTGAVELLSEHPKFAIDYLLALDGELNEHLVSVDGGACLAGPRASALRGGAGDLEGQDRDHQGAREDGRARPRCSTWSRATAGSRRSSG